LRIEPQAIGGAVAGLHYLRPAALEATLTVLGDELAAGLPPTRQPRVAALLAALAAGFYQQARLTVLADQEEIRRAVVAERDALATAHRASEARYRTIFEQAALGIALFAADSRLLETNPALDGMLGYTGDELRRLSFTAITHPDDVAATLQLYQELVAGPRDVAQMEKRYLRRDGVVVWARLTASLVRAAADAPLFAIALVEDITEAKRAHAGRVAARRRLHAAREAERLHLARELHDGPLQDLEGVLFRLLTGAREGAGMPGGSGASPPAEKIREVIETLRTICGELRPPTLVHYGLAQAICSHVARLAAAQPDLVVRLELMPDDQVLPEPVGVALYRIYQQALQNVLQHARARTVLVRLTLDVEALVLEVRDDGCGFAVPEDWSAMTELGHLGLLGATERAEAIGGRLEIQSTPGTGTLLRVTAPRRPNHDRETAE